MTGGEVTWSRFVWRYLDQAAAAALWEELTDWVQWLRERYELGSKLPACWFRHGPVVEELTALMSAHTAAYQQLYTVKGAPVRDWDLMITWHRGELAPALSRISAVLRDCQSGTHQSFVGKNPVDDGLDAFLAEDISRRTEATTADGDDDDDDAEFDELDDLDAEAPPEPETRDAQEMSELAETGAATLDDDGRGADYNGRHWTYDPDEQQFIADE